MESSLHISIITSDKGGVTTKLDFCGDSTGLSRTLDELSCAKDCLMRPGFPPGLPYSVRDSLQVKCGWSATYTPKK